MADIIIFPPQPARPAIADATPALMLGGRLHLALAVLTQRHRELVAAGLPPSPAQFTDAPARLAALDELRLALGRLDADLAMVSAVRAELAAIADAASDWLTWTEGASDV